MNRAVDIIKERLPVVDVLSSYISLTKAGKNYKARCPFHNEKTPSFFISPERNNYYCFGCGAKGDIFSFVEHFEGTDFLGALKMLALRAGVSLENYKKDSNDSKEVLYDIMEEATSYFENALSLNTEANAYLIARGVHQETIKLFRIGYAKKEWKSLLEHLKSKGYKIEDIEKVGLIKNKGENYYDRFRSRIMFPICDSSGRVIAFSGRIFGNDKLNGDFEEAKYINSPDTILFNKSNVLFGIDKAKTAIRTRGYSIVVEGQMDLIMSHQSGFTNTVAVSGTALSDEVIDNESKINNLGLIRRLSSNVIFAFDGDSAGVRASNRSALIALSLDMQVKIANLKDDKDPADIILEDPLVWKDIIKNSINIIDFHLDKICDATFDIRIKGRMIREKIFPLLLMIQSQIERSAYISSIYKKTGISENAIIEDFSKYQKEHPSPLKSGETNVNNNKKEGINRKDILSKKVFSIMFWQKDNNEVKNIVDSFINKIGSEEFENLKESLVPYQEDLSFEASTWYDDNSEKALIDFNESLLNLEEEILIDKNRLLHEKIKQKEKESPSEEFKELLINYQKNAGRIEDIKNSRLN